jgi:hypothetical protein
MKVLIKLALTYIVSLDICANNLTWVDKQILEIKQKRAGIKNSNIVKIKNPFIFLEKNGYNIVSTKKVKNTKVTKKRLKEHNTIPILEMIINKSALINGQWYQVNSVVDGYKINAINKDSVDISFKNKKFILSHKSKIGN